MEVAREDLRDSLSDRRQKLQQPFEAVGDILTQGRGKVEEGLLGVREGVEDSLPNVDKDVAELLHNGPQRRRNNAQALGTFLGVFEVRDERGDSRNKEAYPRGGESHAERLEACDAALEATREILKPGDGPARHLVELTRKACGSLRRLLYALLYLADVLLYA